MNFGESLRRTLEKHAVTPCDLADKTGIDITNISHYLHDQRKPGLPTLRKMLKALPPTADLRELLLYEE